jgi:hypothetical protein
MDNLTASGIQLLMRANERRTARIRAELERQWAPYWGASIRRLLWYSHLIDLGHQRQRALTWEGPWPSR